MKERIKKILFEMMYFLYNKKIIRNKLSVKSIEETIQALQNSNKSLVRYGDAELRMIDGNSVEFQNYDEVLAKRMLQVLQSNEERLLVAIPDIFESLECYTDKSKAFWKEHLFFNRRLYYKYCAEKKTFYNAFVSRCYYMIADKEKSGYWFAELKKIWQEKDIMIVEGDVSHNGVDNDLFDEAKSLRRIICPGKSAYTVYDRILEQCLKCSKDILFLVALGNTAKVLVDDLVKNGYRAIDIGNLDMEYDWFLAKAEIKLHPKKHDCTSREENIAAGYEEYLSQIVVTIN